ncbi:hypothetical protein [Salipaludibacillus sp. CF4.18]|uniref:hypothetical protein n=1 Tax=Salipaludibacillus sp. CF4.18 TaxID=3373081 RepID=UPI003EE4691B
MGDAYVKSKPVAAPWMSRGTLITAQLSKHQLRSVVIIKTNLGSVRVGLSFNKRKKGGMSGF